MHWNKRCVCNTSVIKSEIHTDKNNTHPYVSSGNQKQAINTEVVVSLPVGTLTLDGTDGKGLRCKTRCAFTHKLMSHLRLISVWLNFTDKHLVKVLSAKNKSVVEHRQGCGQFPAFLKKWKQNIGSKSIRCYRHYPVYSKRLTVCCV